MTGETLKCDWCEKEFTGDAESFVESGIDLFIEPEEGEEWKGDQPPGDYEFSVEMRRELREELGINDEELEELLTHGKIDGLGSIVCPECRNSCGSEPLEE